MDMGEIQDNTALIVPCYNEEHRLEVGQFVAFLREYSNYFAVFVDDGSRDGTLELLNDIQNAVGHRRVQIVSLPKNRGKAEAIRQGVLLALSPEFQHDRDLGFVGFLDADLATPLDELRRLVDVADRRDDIDLVIGSRIELRGHFVERKPFRKIAGRLFSFFASRMMGLPVHDTQCGAKVFRCGRWLESVFKRKFSDGWLFDIEILARTRQVLGPKANLKVYEYPLEAWREMDGSKLKLGDFINAPWRLIQLVFEYRLIHSMRRIIADAFGLNQEWKGTFDAAQLIGENAIEKPGILVPVELAKNLSEKAQPKTSENRREAA